MIKNFQEKAELTPREQSAGCIATVGAVYADGITLQLPGETTVGPKRYPFNAAVVFSPGQRVHIAREGGTIIVEYPLGGQKEVTNSAT